MSAVFSGKTVAITGATSGIGFETARQLLEQGATVVVLGRPSSRLDAAVDKLGERAFKRAVDFADHHDIGQAIDAVVAEHGALDILIANAGAYVDGEVIDNDPERWDEVLNINVNGTFKTVQAALKVMRTQGYGDVILTSSIAGIENIAEAPIYAASKYAVQGFAHTTRRQVAKLDIRIGAILPGPVETPLLEGWEKSRLEAIRQSGALDPTDVSESILFMLSRPRHVMIRDLVIIPAKTERF
ncbi:SDR family oxidoreductase [Carnimonas bestiolae]|uniref:SDR family oxidoreductase n=1 Tax=Carnimonas bestiolae TaxID=3402172 RepID=UPI003EDBA233